MGIEDQKIDRETITQEFGDLCEEWHKTWAKTDRGKRQSNGRIRVNKPNIPQPPDLEAQEHEKEAYEKVVSYLVTIRNLAAKMDADLDEIQNTLRMVAPLNRGRPLIWTNLLQDVDASCAQKNTVSEESIKGMIESYNMRIGKVMTFGIIDNPQNI